MNRQHNYEEIIKEKLNELPAPDVSGLWQSMEAILDKEMPVAEDNKRRFILMDFNNKAMLVAATMLIVFGCAYTFKQLNNSYNKIDTVNNITASPLTTNQQVTINNITTKSNRITGQQKNDLTNSQVNQSFNNSIPQNVQGSDNSVALSGGNVIVGETNNQILQEFAGSAGEKSFIANEIVNGRAGVNVEPGVLHAENFSLATPAKKAIRSSDKGFAAGISLNYAMATGAQRKAELDMNGKKSTLQDFIPSGYVQYHFNKKLYAQVELQPVSPQYTPNFTVYHNINQLNPDEKEEKLVKLNKTFYLNLPVSVHYSPVKNLSVGVGVQYSKLKKIILQDEEYYHLIGANGWNRMETKNEVAVRDPNNISKSSADVVDSVAASIKKEDIRLLADVNYNFKGLNVGVRYSKAANNYINTNFTNLAVKDKNHSLQLYVRYNIFDKRKK